jgi:hypothetical protein
MHESNPHDQALENLLQAAPLRAPSPRFDARMDSVFTVAESSRRNRWRLVPLAIAAGVIVAAAPTLWLFRTAANPQLKIARLTPASHPIESANSQLRIERDVSRVFDDGIVAVSDNSPYRQIRRQTVRDIWYVDPRTHARLLVRVPSEQVLVQKVEAF